MAQNAPSKIHVVTRAYLAGWAPAPGGVLRPVSVEYGEQKPKNPSAVGWVKDWWGSGDPALNEACERACRPLEGIVPALLREVEERWPFAGDDDDRGILGQFMALHVLRTDAAKQFFAVARENSQRKSHAGTARANPAALIWATSDTAFSSLSSAASSACSVRIGTPPAAMSVLVPVRYPRLAPLGL